MNKHSITLAMLLALLPVGAQASYNYDYVEGGLVVYPGYRYTNAFRDQDLIGLRAGVNFGITNEIFGFGNVRYLTDKIDEYRFTLGGAYRLTMIPKLDELNIDVYAGGALEYIRASGDIRSDSDLGGSARLGARYRLSNDFEVAAEARAVRLRSYLGNHVGITGRALYRISSGVQLMAEVDVEGGEPGLVLGARFSL